MQLRQDCTEKWCRIVSFPLPIVPLKPSKSLDPWKWNEVDVSFDLPWSVFCSYNSGTLYFLSPHLFLGALWGALLQVEVPEVPKPPKAPEVPEVPELPKAPQGPMGQGRFGTCGFDKLDIFSRNMFWGLADFRWMWTDSIVWYWVGSCAVLWVPKCQKEYLTHELHKM